MAFWIVLMLAATGDRDTAVIVNSGSTNRPGFRIVVQRSGKARNGTLTRTVPKQLVRRFYEDLGKPLAELPKHSCMKSASFGTRLTIEFHGETSPDLSCGDHGDAREKALVEDTEAIVKLFEKRGG